MKFEDKVTALEDALAGLPGALVAFSGGVDSTALVWAAIEALGRDSVVAVTADSPSYPAAEKREAEQIARDFGVRHVVLATDELARAGYRQNGVDRCYFCKAELFEQVAARIAKAAVPDWPILYGAIADDLGDHRPGQRAAAESGVRAPLAEAGMTKDDVRRYSRDRGLPTAAKPSFACLASRVQYGTAIDRRILERIELAEDMLRERGYRQFRVRHHGAVARIELPRGELARAVEVDSAALVTRLKELGWVWVTLDLDGFRSGSMNEVLEDGQTE